MREQMKMTRMITVCVLALVMMMSMTVSVFADSVTKKEAISKALKDAGLKRSEVKNLEAEREKGIFEIEFTKRGSRVEFDYEIRRNDGKILEKEVDYNRRKSRRGEKIGKDAARKAAAEHAGVDIDDVKAGTCIYDREDREYEVKFRSAGNKYKYDIDAVNSKIREYSIKYKK